MSVYTEFFLSSSRSVAQLQLLAISHPNFTQTYRKVRNARLNVTVTDPVDGSQEYTYLPMKIVPLSTKDDLDTGIKVDMGDLGETFPKELDAVDAADGYNIRPVVKYSIYASNELDTPLYGPVSLQIKDIAFSGEGVSFEASPPSLNVNKTGLLYQYLQFPTLRGFI